MTKIKLCGLTSVRDAAYANEAGPDFAGFVFEKGRHFVSDETASAMRRMLDPRIQSVGIFVREDLEHIISLVERGVIQMVQLHGGEPEDYVHELKQRLSVPVIRVISVKTMEDVVQGQNTEADYLLLDNGKGGTGKAFDWSMIPHIRQPWFMAGGIGMENLEQALSFHPWAVDISSGAETDGQKDRIKMKTLVRMVRQEERSSHI